MESIEGWIWLENLDPLIAELVGLADYVLSDGERDAIRTGVERSNADISPPQMLEWIFEGKQRILAKLGWDQGTNVLHVKLQLPPSLVARAVDLLRILQAYTLRARDVQD